MKMTIKDAMAITSGGNKIPVRRVREGFVVNLVGVVMKKGKKSFINVKAICEGGEFFLQHGEKVQVIPKVAVSA